MKRIDSNSNYYRKRKFTLEIYIVHLYKVSIHYCYYYHYYHSFIIFLASIEYATEVIGHFLEQSSLIRSFVILGAFLVFLV